MTEETLNTQNDAMLPRTPTETPPSAQGQVAEPIPALNNETTDRPTDNKPLPSPAIAISPDVKSLLFLAIDKIRFRKKAKLEKIIQFARKNGSITNDQTQKLIRCSDATATRYLSELVKNNLLKKTGATISIKYEPTS